MDDAHKLNATHPLDHQPAPHAIGIFLRQAGDRKRSKAEDEQDMFNSLSCAETAVFILISLIVSFLFLVSAIPAAAERITANKECKATQHTWNQNCVEEIDQIDQRIVL